MAASPEKKLATASIKPSNDNGIETAITITKPGIGTAVKAKVEAKVGGNTEAKVDMDMDVDMDIVPKDDGQARMNTETIQIMVQALPRVAGEKLLSPGGAAHLALDSEYRLREIIQDSVKFMKHSKRSKLLPEDVNSALRLRNLSPIYGFGKIAPPAANSLLAKTSTTLGPTATIQKKKGTSNKKQSPKAKSDSNSTEEEDIKQLSWRPATGVDNLYFTVDRPSNLRKILECPLPPLPLEVTISSHWLAVNGVQPAVPQNPPPANDDEKSTANGINEKKTMNGTTANGTVVAPDGATVRHVLSKELQLYFDHLRDTLFENDNARKNSVLQSVAEEPGLVQVLPYFVLHVTTTVSDSGTRKKGAKNTNANAKPENKQNNNTNIKSANNNTANSTTTAAKNVHNNNNISNGTGTGNGNSNALLRLTSMMRLVRAMHRNIHFKLESYLHALFPSIITCVVRRRLCDKPQDDHWALRDYSSRLLRDLCESYRTKYHNTQTRCSRTFIEAFIDPSKALTTHYGAIVGLTIFGKHVVDAAVLPTVAEYVQRILGHIRTSQHKKRSVRKFEFAKVLGAIVAALNVSAGDNKNIDSGNGNGNDVDKAVQVAVDNKLDFNTGEFAQVVRNAEKEFGKRIYPHQKKDGAF